jgi:3-oxoacyl-[acyl-carrier protein] reductase
MVATSRVAVVTGAATGIGRAVAVRLARAGFRVALSYLSSESQARDTIHEIEHNGGEALAVQGDVSRDADCRRMATAVERRWGRVDVLVNNAGFTRAVPAADLDSVSEEDWDRTFAVNVKGAFLMARACATSLRAARGCLVNVSSTAGLSSVGSSIAYAASKASLNNLTVSLARALAPHVRVNAVLPGFVDTAWNERTLGRRLPAMRELVSKQALLQRVGQPEHVAQLVCSIVDGMDWVTGQLLVADGGLLARG